MASKIVKRRSSLGYDINLVRNQDDQTGEVTFTLNSVRPDGGAKIMGSNQPVSAAEANNEAANLINIDRKSKERKPVTTTTTIPEAAKPTTVPVTPSSQATRDILAQVAGTTPVAPTDKVTSIAEFKAGVPTIDRAFKLISNRYPGSRIDGNKIVGIRNGLPTEWIIDTAGNIIATGIGESTTPIVPELPKQVKTDIGKSLTSIVKKGKDAAKGIDLGVLSPDRLTIKGVAEQLADLKQAGINEQFKIGQDFVSGLRTKRTVFDKDIAKLIDEQSSNIEKGYGSLFDKFDKTFQQNKANIEANQSARNAQISGALRGAGLDNVNALAIAHIQSGLANTYNQALTQAEQEYNKLVTPYTEKLIELKNKIVDSKKGSEQDKLGASNTLDEILNKLAISAVATTTEIQAEPLADIRTLVQETIAEKGINYSQMTPSQKIASLTAAVGNLVVPDPARVGIEAGTLLVREAVANAIASTSGNLTTDLKTVLAKLRGSGLVSKQKENLLTPEDITSGIAAQFNKQNNQEE